MSDDRLPIQVVIPRETDYSANKGSGSNKPLCEYTEDIRAAIEEQCVNLGNELQTSFDEFPNVPGIAKVIMKERAIAKSHKPTAIFKSKTCPIVGAERLDEILIKVTPVGIKRLINTVKAASTNDVQIAMTKIDKIEPYLPINKIMIEGYPELKKIERPLKIKLFSFDDDADNKYFVKGFEDLLEELQITDEVTKLSYTSNSNIYKINCRSKKVISQILKYPGVQRISFFPQYTHEPLNIKTAKKYLNDLPVPQKGKSYPIIGLIDSGISPDNKYLAPWVIGREEYVPKEYQNNEHGTFVAGIIEFGQLLNGLSPHQEHFQILDVVVFPNDDEKKGKTDALSEDVLVEILHDVIKRHHKEIKVWNISLGTDELCGEIISDLGMSLDEIQDLYKVEIILSAGNYEICPLREWPPKIDRNDKDRITIPADSVRAISVGSVANIGINGFVEEEMPSPFSRKGPGANHLVKPDVVFYGGNSTSSGNVDGTGVISFGTKGNIVEGIGTSYSAPAISAIYASILNSVMEKRAREFAKAFLIHSCTVPKIVKTQVTDYNKYFGHGKPKHKLQEILACSMSEVTLIFSGKLFDGSFIEFNDFPFPKSLVRNKKCFGIIKMTLVYTPKINVTYGQEYCRANIDAHLGTYNYLNEDGEAVDFKGEVPLEKKWDEKYETSRVQNGFKWNPIKSYYRELARGIAVKPWRLKIDCIARSEETYSGQQFVLLITIIDPQNNDIYSEMQQMLRERGYLFNNLKLQDQIRQQIGL